MDLKQFIYFLLGLFLLAGCNSSKNDSASAGDIQKLAPEIFTVEISGMKFNPDTLYVQKGDSVIFVNKGIVDHDITALDASWTSGALPVGAKWGMKITKDTPYFCSIHVIMKGVVFVE